MSTRVRRHQLFLRDAPTSGTLFLYSAYAPAQRMSKSGGVSAAASTTLTADTLTEGGNRGPFSNFGIGDNCRFYSNAGQTVAERKVAAVASNASITLSAVITLSGHTAWDYQKRSYGLSDSTSPLGSQIGWVDTSYWAKPVLILGVETLPTSGFNYVIEVRDPETQIPAPWFTGTIAALTDVPAAFEVPRGSIRVGIMAVALTDFDGSVTISINDSDVVS